MNFFKQKNKNIETVELEVEPVKLHASLTKPHEYTYLRGIQEEVLAEFHSRRDEKDLIIKMNTGAGKTLTGLLMLYSKMIESKKPVVYMCPDKQLFNQVLEQSKNYGIPTCVIDNNNDFPEKFLNSEAVLVDVVHRMFNGKNVFDREKINLEAILIDDAHKCAEKIIEQFTLTISGDHELYKSLQNLFEEDLREQSIGSYEAIKQGEPSYYLKVPYWRWMDKEEQVTALLVEHLGDAKTMLFKWDLMVNNLSQYEMLIQSNKIEISPIISYAKNIVAYDNAKHRYALSATFVNDYSLLKDLDFSFDSVVNPITPKNRKDYGQRLILTPRRYYNNFSNELHFEVINHHLKNKENVVVLVPSDRIAKQWGEIGATIINKTNIDKEIQKLKSSTGNFVVFSNRYDGIDLSGNSCNVLILFDHPKHKFLKDKYYQNIHHETNSNMVAQTIEQGMGRSVRSSSDFSVIYLMGRHNLKFLRKRENLNHFNMHTRRQIEMGLSLLDGVELNDENAVKKITEIADYCLAQDEEWKKYYKSFMDGQSDISSDNREKKLKINFLEKEAIHLFINDEYEPAIQKINQIIEIGVNDVERAGYYQMQAHIAYKLNKNTANDFQHKARTLSVKMFQPFLGKTKFKHQFSNTQYFQSLEFIKSFSTTNDIVDHIQDILDGLIYDPKNDSNNFEEALKNLGILLGFNSSRPEKELKIGPDVLWVSETNTFILEAKSERLLENKIYKGSVEQLYHSLEWFKNSYIFKGKVLAVTLQPSPYKNPDVATTNETMVLSSNSLDELRDAIISFKKFIVNNELTSLSEKDIKTEFERLHLNSVQIEGKYLKTIT
jgi:hypothetical protein